MNDRRDELPDTASGREGVGRRYDRVSRGYDLLTSPMERMGGRKARTRLLSRAQGEVLEVGVGTGINLEHYPSEVHLTAVDISPRMLERARQRAAGLDRPVDLEVGDVEQLAFPDSSFDTVTATCVFCSVGDPAAGLREVRRVVRPDGHVLLYEHVRPHNRIAALLFDLVSPLVRRLVGPSINRRTEDTVWAAGLELLEVRRRGIWREMVAAPTVWGQES